MRLNPSHPTQCVPDRQEHLQKALSGLPRGESSAFFCGCWKIGLHFHFIVCNQIPTIVTSRFTFPSTYHKNKLLFAVCVQPMHFWEVWEVVGESSCLSMDYLSILILKLYFSTISCTLIIFPLHYCLLFLSPSHHTPSY